MYAVHNVGPRIAAYRYSVYDIHRPDNNRSSNRQTPTKQNQQVDLVDALGERHIYKIKMAKKINVRIDQIRPTSLSVGRHDLRRHLRADVAPPGECRRHVVIRSNHNAERNRSSLRRDAWRTLIYSCIHSFRSRF